MGKQGFIIIIMQRGTAVSKLLRYLEFTFVYICALLHESRIGKAFRTKKNDK